MAPSESGLSDSGLTLDPAQADPTYPGLDWAFPAYPAGEHVPILRALGW